MTVLAANTSLLLGRHLWHIVALAAWVPVFGATIGIERFKSHRRARAERPVSAELRPGRPRYLQTMAIACLCAALIHMAVLADHFRESIYYGTFFVVTAGCQAALSAALLVRPSRPLITAGLVGSGLVIVLWLISRLVGVPIGPDHGATEPFGILDVLASAAEVVTVGAGVLSLRYWAGRPLWRLRTWTLSMRGIAFFCVTGTVAATLVGSRS